MICALGLPSKSMVLGEPPSARPFAAFHPHVYPCRVIPAGVCCFCPDLVSFEFTTPPWGSFFEFNFKGGPCPRMATFATCRPARTISVVRARPEVDARGANRRDEPRRDVRPELPVRRDALSEIEGHEGFGRWRQRLAGRPSIAGVPGHRVQFRRGIGISGRR
jgi:hypothetical protein